MEVLNDFRSRFDAYWLAGMRKKLGLQADQPGDADLVQSLLDWMEESRADFTNTFRDLSESQPPGGQCSQDPKFQDWYSAWNERLASANRDDVSSLMKSVNPAVIPRNHRVEEALEAAEAEDDLRPLNRLLEALAHPFETRPEFSEYREAPEDETGYRTFCGT